ncbi:MAG: shikimate kinase, partial [Verrucomicrobium sp.]
NFLEGKAAIEGAEGQGRYLNQVHRDDVARTLMHLLLGGHQGVFNVVDEAPMTQRECFRHLSARFARPMPPVAPPNNERKRAWTNKRVSNVALLATGYKFTYPSYLDAVAHDPELVSSILAELGLPGTSGRRGRNIVIVGLMGSGKSTVGRMAAQSLRFGFIDTDQIIMETARKSIPDIFAAEGEAGFRKRETEALKSLLGKEGMVIATGGGIVTQPVNLPILKQLGYVVWLNADPYTLYQRTAHNNDRPLLRNQDPAATLRHLYDSRRPLYQRASDLQIGTDDLTAQDVAYGLAESVRVYFR